MIQGQQRERGVEGYTAGLASRRADNKMVKEHLATDCLYLIKTKKIKKKNDFQRRSLLVYLSTKAGTSLPGSVNWNQKSV